MASNCARNLVQRSSNSAKTLLFRGQSSSPVASGPSKICGLVSRPSPRHRPFSSRLPVELGCGESLMPLHSVTASALLTSMLSSKVGRWGFLAEGMYFSAAFAFPDLRQPYNRTFNGDAGKTVDDNSIDLYCRSYEDRQ